MLRVCVILGILVGCAPSTGVLQEEVVFGDDDLPERYPGVVQVVNVPEGLACTGTVIAGDATTGRGWVLTAAHCVIAFAAEMPHGRPASAFEVIVGSSTASTTRLPVTAWYTPPDCGFDRIDVDFSRDGWPTSIAPRDVALLEITGVTTDVAASAIDVLDPAADDLAPGASGVVVGYGLTESGSRATVRQRADVVVYDVVSSLRGNDVVIVDQRDGASGYCFGDSGGPLLRTVGGVPRVAGVFSSLHVFDGTTACGDLSTLARVSTVSAWIRSVMAGDPAPEPVACLACAGVASLDAAACADELATDAVESERFVACMRTQWSGDCRTMFPAGAAAYDGYWACLEAACPACTAADRTVGLCRYQQDGSGPCDACMQTSCCAEMAACRFDAACALCLERTDADRTACAASALYASARGCLDGSCEPECGGYVGALAPAEAPPEIDAGADAGSDAGTDGGVVRDDDAGSIDMPDTGCSCRAAARPEASALPLAFVVLTIALQRRRNR